MARVVEEEVKEKVDMKKRRGGQGSVWYSA